MESEHDQAFLQILRNEKNITNFLDAFFGFLYRCTDFYVEPGPEQKLGFQPGIAENLVLNSLHKWKNEPRFLDKSNTTSDNTNISNNKINQEVAAPIQTENDIDMPPVVQEVEIESERKIEKTCIQSMVKNYTLEKSKPSDSYNGAVRENYTWSQAINDVDVLVKLPNNVKTAKDIRVSLDSQRIKIETKTLGITNYENTNRADNTQWDLIFDGELCFKIKKAESVWSLVPEQQINIHLEKVTERWWNALITGEPKIELNKIDCVRDLHDMGSEEQMKIQELMWNHQQKLLGKPTSDQVKLEQMLKKAWDAQGSPFQGTPYDPSIVKFN